MKKAILITLLGAFIGLIIGIVLMNLDQDGRFTQWHVLDRSVRFKHITKATTGSIQAEAVDDQIYMHDASAADDSEWNHKLFPMTSLINEKMTITNGTCIIEGIKYPKDPAGKVVECARTTGDTGDGIYVTNYYALLDDGSIWVWKYDTFTATLYFPIVATFYGLLIGILISLIFYYLEKRKNRLPITVLSKKE